MEPTLYIAAAGLISNVAIAFFSRGNQQHDKVSEDVTVLKTEVATLKANTANLKGGLDKIEQEVKGMNEKLDRLLERP